MDKGQYLNAILRSPKTVFSLNDISLLWREPSSTAVRNRLHYYLKNKQLLRLRQGIYAKDENYEKLELATKIITPSYVSFETVLASSGFIFQYYDNINIASYLTREIVCDKTTYTFKKIKSTILMNPLGIEQKNECSIASTERALLDTIYLNKEYYFDNLSGLDWDRAFYVVTIYENKRMLKTLENLYKEHKADLK